MKTGDHILNLDTVDATAGVFAHCSCGTWRVKGARTRAKAREMFNAHFDEVNAAEQAKRGAA